MKYDDISPTMRAFLGNREVLRQLGYSADDLYMEVNMSVRFQRLMCFVTLKTKNKEFSIEVGPVDDGEALVAEYERLCDLWNSRAVPQEDMDRILVESEAFQDKTGLIGALMRKGLFPPREKRA